MADVEELVTLLERWRDSSGLGRLNVAVDATRAVRALSPTQKRELAAEVASRVAPQLVPQIRAEEGDLSGEQVAAVVDLLRRADRDQLDDLVTALRSGDVDESLSLVDEALDVVAPGVPVGAAAAAAASASDAVDEEIEGRVEEADRRMDALVDDAVRMLDEATADDGADPGAVEPSVPPPPRAEPTLDEQAVREAAERAAAARAAQWADTSAVRDRPPVELPTVRFDISFDDVELPDPTVEQVAPLEHRRHQLPGAAEAAHDDPSAAQPVVRGSLAAPPTPAVVAAVTATPDGYRRRRAALAAIREGRLDGPDAVTVARSLGRDTDRAWVAGAAVDAGLIGAADLDGLRLGDLALRRLRRRAERVG